MLQIYENAGLTVGGSRISDEFNHGQDVKTQEYGDMYEMGVIDPVKVTKCALQNAVSVAVTLLSTNAIITMARTYEDK
jgi:chaperonin GroEL